jgi:F0F1-type ATP synthase assembly protein I
MRQVGKYLGIGFILPTCVFVGWLIGTLLDRTFHTRFLTLVFLLFGIAAGFISLIRELTQDNDTK